ncbi:hypothetical protein [Propionispira raffinosivorans]|nr:hypothetical protein [Propionispira raffinosivorans]
MNNDQDHIKFLKEVICIIKNKKLILKMKKAASSEKIISLLSTDSLGGRLLDPA